MDYSAYLSSNTNAVTTYYSSYNESINSSAAGTIITELQFKNSMASKILGSSSSDADVNAVLMAHYFNPGSTTPILNYNLGSGNTSGDYEAFASVPGVDFNSIPLFSSEKSNGCMVGLNGFFGDWLGGSNTPAFAESQFVDQLWSTYGALWGSSRANCPNCYTKTKIQGFGWYNLNCMDDNQNNNQTIFTNFGLSNCNGTSSYAIGNSNISDVNEISIYPNPTNENFRIKINSYFPNTGKIMVDILDLNGRLLYHKPLNNSNPEVKIGNLPQGTYLVRVENQTFKLIKI
jgi:hypothetical protein